MDIRKNEITGGQCCVFQKNNEYFYADRSLVPFAGDMETMIFPCDENGEVISWTEVFCDRSGQSLLDCIKEFLNE